MMVALSRFTEAARALGATAAAADLEAAAEGVLAQWRSPERGYHNEQHLCEVLEALDELGSASAAVELAAWFHDVVYTGEPGEDELASGRYAAELLLWLGVPVEATERVVELVLVTTDHLPSPGDREAALLCDADLRILASDPERYAEYAAAVRREYAHVPEANFNRVRADLLEGLLERTRAEAELSLYSVSAPRAWTNRAINNLTHEIALLQS